MPSPFTVSLDDPTGNSWIAPNTADRGLKYKRQEYPRTHEQNEELGISNDANAVAAETSEMDAGNPDDLDIVDGQVTLCPLNALAAPRLVKVSNTLRPFSSSHLLIISSHSSDQEDLHSPFQGRYDFRHPLFSLRFPKQ